MVVGLWVSGRMGRRTPHRGLGGLLPGLVATGYSRGSVVGAGRLGGVDSRREAEPGQ
jgi:hypothetical protein